MMLFFSQKQIKPTGKEKHYPMRKVPPELVQTTGMVDSKSLIDDIPILHCHF